MLTKEGLPACPVATTIGLISNKWKLMILRNLIGGTKRFGELRKSVSDISQKVLTDNLRSMEDGGIILRTVYTEVPPRIEYRLNELGDTLRPIMDAMELWATQY